MPLPTPIGGTTTRRCSVGDLAFPAILTNGVGGRTPRAKMAVAAGSGKL